MAGLAVNDIIQVKMLGTVYQQQVLFVPTFRVKSNTSTQTVGQDLFDVANFFQDPVLSNLLSTYLGMLSTSYSLVQASAQRIYPTKTIYYKHSAIATPGTGGAGTKTANTGGVYTLTAATPGRKNLAKFHPGPLPDAFQASGMLSTGAVAALQLLAARHILDNTITLSDLGTLVLTPVIFHRSPNINPRYDDVVDFRTNPAVRTDRRRTIGVGR